MGKPITDPLDRIMSRITVTGDGCWEYPCRNESGYGVVGEGPRGGKTIRTHRLVYERLVTPNLVMFNGKSFTVEGARYSW